MALEFDIGGGGGGALDGGGGDFSVPLIRVFIRDEIDDEDIDEEEVVMLLSIVLLVTLVFNVLFLSNGLMRSCGSKFVIGLYFSSCSYVSKTLDDGLLLELILPAVSVEEEEVSERPSPAFVTD